MGLKHDQGKERVDLIEPDFMLDLGRVLAFGCIKYEENSWRTVENAEDRYYAAALRHLLAYRKGETMDSETKVSHLSNASACLMFLHYLEAHRDNNTRKNVS